MAGLYVHIPFCKQKCSYCDFHFSTSLKHQTNLVNALVKEIQSKSSLINQQIKTIYFGGGTPSLLSKKELNLLIETIHANYNIAENIEFTLECNPEDLSKDKLKEFIHIGVNRLSIGIQSFFDDDLRFFNRSHSALQAEESIRLSQDKGIENITIDLIYNIPTLTLQKWENNLNKVIALKVPHLSAYTLTIEPKTALYHQVKTKQVQLPIEGEMIKQYELLMEKTRQNGLVQYEVSNFGKEDYFSQHNSNYWRGEEYLGFGPSAHSFYGGKRSWNVANNIKYIQAITKNLSYSENEEIDQKTSYNEYILTRLRTIWGVDRNELFEKYDSKIVHHFNKEIDKYLNSSYLQIENNVITLTQEGMMIVDGISSDLFYVE